MDGKFEELLASCRGALERFVKFRVPDGAAEDLIQDICLTAYKNFKKLKNCDSFKAWLIAIARNICRDYYRKHQLSEALDEGIADSRYGLNEAFFVRDVLSSLCPQDRRILYLYYWRDMPQKEISRLLNIPAGTVKSRLHTAKNNFRAEYQPKGVTVMNKLPLILPDYTITKCQQPPFEVRCEELTGWFIIPRKGQKISWAAYDMPSRNCAERYELEVKCSAAVHGVEGVEIQVKEIPASGEGAVTERTVIAQLTPKYCRYLATSFVDDGVRIFHTFLDEDFLEGWGMGEDNCGKQINLRQKGEIMRDGSEITCKDAQSVFDVVGRYSVTINGKVFDTVCAMDIENKAGGVLTEQFIDKNGRTVLWRRFNRDDWGAGARKDGKTVFRPWSERLPCNERLTVNGETYVHWYDCITDYVI